MCCLSQPESTPELGHLIGQWMKPQDFILVNKSLYSRKMIRSSNNIHFTYIYKQCAYICTSDMIKTLTFIITYDNQIE